MRKYITATALATAAFLMATSAAHALSIGNPISNETMLIQELDRPSNPITKTVSSFKLGSTIGIARLDKGRLIPAPMGELQDWNFLNKRSAANFAPIPPAAMIKNFPEVPMGGRDSDNKIDEIRLTAVDLKMDYVLIYGMGKDAEWGSFGGKALSRTGLRVNETEVSPRAGAKALLVNTYTGEIYGTITSEEIEFGVGDLTDKVDALVDDLISKEGRV